MRLPVTPPRRSCENTAPLIDIVFLLLIFFMLVGVLAPPEPIPVDPPASHDFPAPEDHPVILLLAADGRLAFEGREWGLSALTARLRQHISEDNNIQIDLKADAAVHTERLIAVMDALRSLGIKRISLLTVERGQ